MSNRFQDAKITAATPAERAVAAKAIDDAKWVNQSAEVIYRCKKRGCLLATVVRHQGQRYLVYLLNVPPRKILTPSSMEALPRVAGADFINCFRIADDGTAWGDLWLTSCEHSVYRLTKEQLAADIKQLRGTKRPIVIVDGTNLGHGTGEGPDTVSTDRVR